MSAAACGWSGKVREVSLGARKKIESNSLWKSVKVLKKCQGSTSFLGTSPYFIT